MDIRTTTFEANGIEYGALEAGDGPAVLLLHGFPDSAWTWSHQIPALAEAGHRVVAPFMPGYAPTGPTPDERYDPEALGEHVLALARHLDAPRVIGHDWGAIATYAALAIAPDELERVAVIAVGHPSTFAIAPLSPPLAHHIFHTWLFQVSPLAEIAVRHDDFALVDYLWRLWSPGHDDTEHIARVKRDTLSAPGVVEAALRYYRGLVNLPLERPEFVERFPRPVDTPTLSVFGAGDPVHTLSEGEEQHFRAPYRREVIPGAGHFVHRERPHEVNDLLVRWLAGDREPAAA